jgi:hypothetical protein
MTRQNSEQEAVPRLAVAVTLWQAWWENYDRWDGYALYVDLDLAKKHGEHDYKGDEYGHPAPDDEDEEPGSTPEFTWVEVGGSWHLMDHGQDTLVRLSPAPVYRAASEREIRQQKALQAAEEAERATRPRRPLAEELEEAAGLRSVPVGARGGTSA